MKFSQRAYAAVLLGLAMAEVIASEPVRLICEYSNTVDDQGISSPASGEKLVTILLGKNGIATIKKEDLGAEFSGKISGEDIRGNVEYQIGESRVTEAIYINRYSGRMVATFSISNKSLTHFGKCRPATKLF